MKESLYDVFSDEFGKVDFRRGGAGGMSKSKQIQAFVKILHSKSSQRRDSVYTIQELHKIATDAKLGVENFEQFIDCLNQQGFLLVYFLSAFADSINNIDVFPP